MEHFKNRITGEGEENPGDLLANPLNHRIHPKEQQEALEGALREVGWVQRVIINERTGHILDGHARVALALKRDESAIPVVYVDLSENEERVMLAALDAVTTLAGVDDEMLAQVLENLEVEDADLRAFLDSLLAGEEEEEPDELEEARETLADVFLVPPFSVLDGRSGVWQDRKRAWMALGIRSELGRDGDLLYSLSSQPPAVYDRKRKIEEQEGRTLPWPEFAERFPEEIKMSATSIFDPVLCEVAYRWFCPPGGTILDPFAGGSVRGVVAAMLGQRYTGIELRGDQVDANRKNWLEITGAAAPKQRDRTLPPITEEMHEGIRVIRDDRVEGGTKRRALQVLMEQESATEYVYATPAYGFAQVALAQAAADRGKRVTIFTAQRKRLHRRTLAAQQAGATVHQVHAGYLSHVTARAKEYAKENGARYIEFGGEDQAVIDALAGVARQIEPAPTEVWTVAGSGVLSRALQQAWPEADFHAVQIGAKPDAGRAQVHKAAEKFEDPAKHPPPFPSCPEYDAKAWMHIQREASPGALFWNVAGEATLEAADAGENEPEWIAGDSLEMDQHLPDGATYDLVFTCPPYGDLEVYSEDPRDISTMDYQGFVDIYRRIIAEAAHRLKDDRFMVIVVGEIRGKDGGYRSFVPDTIRAAEEAGLRYYNEAVLVTPTGSLALRAASQFTNSRKLGKGHQNMMVFAKGEPSAADFHTPEGLSEALTQSFADHRALLEAARKVLVFSKGDPKAAAADIGHSPIADPLDEWVVDASEVDT